MVVSYTSVGLQTDKTETMGYYEAPSTWVSFVNSSELLDGFTGRTPMSDSMSCLLGWSDCSEKNLPIFHLEGESLVVSVLETEWGKKWLSCFKIHYLHCSLSSFSTWYSQPQWCRMSPSCVTSCRDFAWTLTSCLPPEPMRSRRLWKPTKDDLAGGC